MPNLEDLVVLLSGIHITDRTREQAYAVAGHLVASTLRERWHELPERQRQILIKQSGNRLWDAYKKKRRNEYEKSRDAATEAIAEEMAFLQQSANPENRPSIL